MALLSERPSPLWWLRRWWDPSWRRATNEAGVVNDHVGFSLAACLFPVLLVLKTWLREGLPGLALKSSLHALLAALMAFLSGHKGRWRQWYVDHREAMYFAHCLNMQWVVRLTACHGAVNTIDHHGGSAWGLLTLLLGHTTALYGALYVLYARLVLPASAALLATLAATTLWSGERMCLRVLESPGVEEPLSRLHMVLGLAMGLPAPPGASAALTSQVAGPMQQCLAVSAWLSLVVGTLLPLSLLAWLEPRMRRAHEERQRRQQHEEQRAAQVSEPHCGGDEWGMRGPLVLYAVASSLWCMVCSVYGTGWQR